MFLKNFLNQSGSKEEVEHADILELNTIIDTLRKEKRELENDKVCICRQMGFKNGGSCGSKYHHSLFLTQQISRTPPLPVICEPNIQMDNPMLLCLAGLDAQTYLFLSLHPQVALVEELNTAEDRCRDGESQSAVELAQEVSDLKSQLEDREQAFKRAHLDIETLTAELEVLDKQNQEATQVHLPLDQCRLHALNSLCNLLCFCSL